MAVVIVVALASYALHLHRKLQRVDVEREKAKLAFEQQLKDKTAETSKSITILARALVAEELSVTEACLRISWLLTQINPDARESEAYSVFFQVADATAHIPILDAWKSLSREQRKAFDRERLETEKAFGDFVLDAAKKLLDEGVPKPAGEASGLYYSA
ncbi:MAG: DUF2489 domain-containing protein [Gammaproteobacteria bacterium]|nr:DUF2489 domain-containing protein [Gammaproteobacteria bacterium]MBQ0838762.1 DUF2489 domain-containing protein [Gammaproteobacteria bacterium]